MAAVPEEAGFGVGQAMAPCEDGSGECYAGLDVPTCESSLDITCNTTTNVKHEIMLDSCGGHAMPYHYHNDLKCDYGVFEIAPSCLHARPSPFLTCLRRFPLQTTRLRVTRR